MPVTPELRAAKWLLNTDTGLIFPQNGSVATAVNLAPYFPTEEEMLAGRRIVAVPVIVPVAVQAEFTPEPDPPPQGSPPEPSSEPEPLQTLEQAEAPVAEAEFTPEPDPPLPAGVIRRGPGRPRKE